MSPLQRRLMDLPVRTVRAMAAQAGRERMRIQQQALCRGASVALGERLSGVDAIERACRQELARRGRWCRVRSGLSGLRSSVRGRGRPHQVDGVQE
ncbi:MAG: hypothetical protein U0Y82_07740 [Thermoleophilia bacterium]